MELSPVACGCESCIIFLKLISQDGSIVTHLCVEQVNPAMGTVISQKIYCRNSEKTALAAVKTIRKTEGLFSFFLPGSDIYKLNRAAGKSSIKINPETYFILEKARELGDASRGAFDITIGPLSAMWKECISKGIEPDRAKIGAVKNLVDYRELELNKGTAFLKHRGRLADPGGIGKGYAADKIIALYRKKGIKSAYVSFGGNVYVLGNKPDGTPWRVGIIDPQAEGSYLGVLSIADKSVVTSGDYEHCFESNGKVYHHLIDPRTGYPAETGLRSVTVVSKNSMLADAIATAAFILGFEDGLKLVHEYGLEAIFAHTGGKVSVTPGLRPYFQHV